MALCALCASPIYAHAAAPASGGTPSPLVWNVAHTWQQSEGLPQNNIYCLLQTHDGYLWIGTRAGLARFDGNRFVTFDDSSGSQLHDNEVWNLAEAGDGSLLIATYGGGLTSYKNGTFRTYTTRDGLTSNFIQALAPDHKGGVWIGMDAGLGYFRDGVFTRLSGERVPPKCSVRCIFPSDDDTTWVATMADELFCIKKDHFESVKIQGPNRHVEIHGLVVKNGVVWVAALDGLYRIQGDDVRRYSTENGLSSNAVRTIYSDDDGAIWVGTDAGIDQIIDDRLYHVHTSSIPILAIFRDREGSLWVSRGSESLARLRTGQFRSYTRADGLLTSYVAASVEDRHGNIWIATVQGLYCLKNGKIVSYPLKDRPESGRLASLAVDRDGYIWVGSEDGIYRFKYDPDNDPTGAGPNFEPIPISELPHVFCRIIYQDRDGTMWFGTNMDGLIRYQNGKSLLYTTHDGLGHNAVRGIVEDRDGNLWVTTKNGGLTRIRDGQFKTFRAADGLVSDMAQALYHGSDDSLWIGTRQGMSRYKDGRFINYLAKDGLYSNYIYGMCEDGRGNLWMSCAKGIFRASMAQLDDFAAGKIQSIDCTAYGLENGLASTTGAVANHPVVNRSADGRIWFSMTNGICVVNTDEIPVNRLPPPVHVEEVTINGQNFDLRQPIVAPPGRGDLVFRYTGLSFVAPERMRFQYQLAGYDHEWLSAGNRREVYYNRLPPGRYVFRVKAANNDGVWSKDEAAISVEVLPYFYQTLWFRALLVVLIGTAVAVFYRRHVGEVRRRAEDLQRMNEELERRVSQRTGELAKSYEDLRASQRELMEASRLAGIAEVATGVLHNIGNVLNSVNVSAVMATERLRESKLPKLDRAAKLLKSEEHRLAEFCSTDPRAKQLPRFIDEVVGAVQREHADIAHELTALTSSVDHIKEIVAAQQNFASASILVEDVPPTELMETALRISEASLSRHGITVLRELAPDLPLICVPRQKVLQVLVNLIRNAKESLNECGRTDRHLAVGIQLSDTNKIRFSVRDNGLGIAPENLKQIFGFGFTTKKDGHGFGLHGSALAAQDLGGALTATSEGLGFGATFVLELPPSDPRRANKDVKKYSVPPVPVPVAVATASPLIETKS